MSDPTTPPADDVTPEEPAEEPAAAAAEEAEEEQPSGLPPYRDGRIPSGMVSSFAGTGNRILRPHNLGDRVVIVIEAEVTDTGHRKTKDGLQYHEKFTVLDLFEASGEPGRRLLTLMRSTYREASDSAAGTPSLPGTVVHTDPSGIVLTDAEVAELRGDPAAAMFPGKDAPVVLELESGLRVLWPEDLPAGTPRPSAGDVIQIQDDEQEEVYEVLDRITGETLDSVYDDPAPDDDDAEEADD